MRENFGLTDPTRTLRVQLKTKYYSIDRWEDKMIDEKFIISSPQSHAVEGFKLLDCNNTH